MNGSERSFQIGLRQFLPRNEVQELLQSRQVFVGVGILIGGLIDEDFAR